MGSDDELADRRSRDGRRAEMGASSGCARHPWDRQGGEWRVGPDRADRAAAAARQRTHAARCQRGAHRRLRHRLRDPQSDLDLPLHRHDAAGGFLPRPARAAGRRRRTCASAGGRTGPQHRCAGCGESGMEAGSGDQADIAGKPAGYLPRRALSRSCPRAAQHDGAGRASSDGRPQQGAGRHHDRTARHGRAAQKIRR